MRTQAAKERVRECISTGLVLTIYEAKGLEFVDVLVFNFWADSALPASKWRAVYEVRALVCPPSPL